jgi:KamA family protein
MENTTVSVAPGRGAGTEEVDMLEVTRYHALGPHQLETIAERYGLSNEQRETIAVHSAVLPFRTNSYVLDELIDWSAVPDDPMYQLVFPQPGMLSRAHERQAHDLVANAPRAKRIAGINAIRDALNPHPAGQRELNVPDLDDEHLDGVQHKYQQTVLYFPAQGQTCHAYCTYCFRWAQFVGDADLKFAAKTPDALVRYLGEHPEVTDVLVTGGDPMIMTTQRLRNHLEPLLQIPTLQTIRFGTKSLAYWPQRFVSDADADDLLRLFDEIIAAGKTVAVMAHFSHDRELSTDLVRTAMARIRATGAVIYCQAPIMRRINDDADTWRRMWTTQLSLGAVPYYMFMARDTGPREYFEVPIARAVEVFHGAYQSLPGLARTVRGPSMSSTPGKIAIDGVVGAGSSRAFSARFLQARDPALVGRPFQFHYSATAVWADQLDPMPGTPRDILRGLEMLQDEDDDSGAA